MKVNFREKCICLILIFSLTLQSCSVYKNESITFEQAIAKHIKVKATTKDGNKIIIKNIQRVDNVYYGQVDSGEGFKKEIINERDYDEIRPKDEGVSWALIAQTVIAGLVTLGLLTQRSS